MQAIWNAIAIASAVAFAGPLQAQEHPTGPVTMIVPFSPAGANDLVARFLAEGLQERWSQPVVVENRVGAGGQVGTSAVAQAAGDGQTILFTSPAFTTLPAINESLPYDPVNDFRPVALVGMAPFVVSVGPDVAAENLTEFVAETNARDMFYSSPGVGSAVHLASELFFSATGTEMKPVVFSGGTEALIDVAAGRTSMYIGTLATLMPFLEDDRVRIIGVLGDERLASHPDVGTSAEAGFPGASSGSWWGVFLPASASDDLVARLNSDVLAVMSSPEAEEFASRMHFEPGTLLPAEFTALVTDEITRWTDLVDERRLNKN